jgi:hypothetical protein
MFGRDRETDIVGRDQAELIKLGHPLIGAPYNNGKRDKLYGEEEETKTPEAPG